MTKKQFLFRIARRIARYNNYSGHTIRSAFNQPEYQECLEKHYSKSTKLKNGSDSVLISEIRIDLQNLMLHCEYKERGFKYCRDKKNKDVIISWWCPKCEAKWDEGKTCSCTCNNESQNEKTK